MQKKIESVILYDICIVSTIKSNKRLKDTSKRNSKRVKYKEYITILTEKGIIDAVTK